MTATRPTLRPKPLPPAHWRLDGKVWRYAHNGLEGSLWTAGTDRLVQGGPVRVVQALGGILRDDLLTLDDHEQWSSDLIPMLRYLRATRTEAP